MRWHDGLSSETEEHTADHPAEQHEHRTRCQPLEHDLDLYSKLLILLVSGPIRRRRRKRSALRRIVGRHAGAR